MSTPFIPTGRGNPCPICDDTSSKCRTLRNSDTVLCMTSAGYDAAIAGYRYVGDDKKQHLWGIYVTDDGSTGKDRAAIRAERARRAEEQRQKELFELSFSLPIGERSAQNRGLLLQLDLDGDHWKNLRERGLSDAQIQAGLFKSVEPSQKLSHPISPRLAGIDRNAERIFVSGRGLLCPAFDPYGRILGMQLRLDNPSGGKYRWLKSQNSSKLPNGEMPLTTVKPEGQVRHLGLCEGIIKPYVSAVLSGNTLFIGAAGGNFHASRRQLEEVLKWARDEYGELPILLYPDGGGLANRQVFHRDLNTLNLLRHWGKSVQVAYWEQGFSKTVPDIDELLAAGRGSQIRTLTVAQYQQLRHDAIWGWQEPLKTIEQLFRRIEVEGREGETGRRGDGETGGQGDKGTPRQVNRSTGQQVNGEKNNKPFPTPFPKGDLEIERESNCGFLFPHTPHPTPHTLPQGRLGDKGENNNSPFPVPHSPHSSPSDTSHQGIDESNPLARLPSDTNENNWHIGENRASHEGMEQFHIPPDARPDTDTSNQFLVEGKESNQEIDRSNPLARLPSDTNENNQLAVGSRTSHKRIDESNPLARSQSDVLGNDRHIEESGTPDQEVDKFHTLASSASPASPAPPTVGVPLLGRRSLASFADAESDLLLPPRGPTAAQIHPKITNLPLKALSPSPIPPLSDSPPPSIEFEKGQRLNVIAEATAKGWKHILDNSACGAGKSFDVGVATPSRFGVRKLWALSPTHRNPTTASLEANYTDLTVRNNGFKLDPHRRTELRNPYRLWPGLGETPETVGNCHRTSLFRTLADKNFPNIEAKDNPICATCHLHGACAHSSGNGYGFRHQRRQDLQSAQIRAHPDSCPVPGEYDYSGDGAFWDEVGTTFQATRLVSASAWDLHQVAAELAVDFPKLWHRLQPFVAALDNLLNDPAPPYHGWNDSDVRSMLPSLEEASARELSEELYNIFTKRDLGLEAEDAIDYSQLDWQERKGIGWANRLLKAHTRQKASVAHQAVGNIPTNWTIPFLEVLSRLTSGALRVHRGRLIVTIASYRHPDLASAMSFNVYQDATMSRWRLALMLGIDESEILVIAQKKAPTPNLSIIQIPDIGLATNGRSRETDRRIEALVKAASERHDNVAVAEWKRKMDSIPDRCETRLTLLGDTRGSNRAKTCDALVICGTTFRNIGALEDEYRTLTGRDHLIPGTAKACTRRQTIGEIPPGLLDYVERTVSADAGLQAYIDDDVSSEMKQATERLRAHLRLEETLTVYVVSSHPLPFQVTLERAFDICPEAGNKQQRKWHLIREAIARLREMGEKVTQKAIEGITGVPQNSIGRLCGAIEGFSWKKWLKISTSLIETSFNKMDIFREIDQPSLDFGWPILDSTHRQAPSFQAGERPKFPNLQINVPKSKINNLQAPPFKDEIIENLKSKINNRIDDEGVILSRENRARVDRSSELGSSLPIPYSSFPSPNREVSPSWDSSPRVVVSDESADSPRGNSPSRSMTSSGGVALEVVGDDSSAAAASSSNDVSSSVANSDASGVTIAVATTVRTPEGQNVHFSPSSTPPAPSAPPAPPAHLHRFPNNVSVLDEEARSIARDYLPILADCESDEAISTLILLWEGFEERWDSVVGWMSSQIRGILLAHLLSLLPPQAQEILY